MIHRKESNKQQRKERHIEDNVAATAEQMALIQEVYDRCVEQLARLDVLPPETSLAVHLIITAQGPPQHCEDCGDTHESSMVMLSQRGIPGIFIMGAKSAIDQGDPFLRGLLSQVMQDAKMAMTMQRLKDMLMGDVN